MASVGVIWSGKTDVSFYWPTKNKSWPELLHWSVEDFLTAWMSSTLSGQWLRLHASQRSVTPRKSDATVFLRQKIRDFIAADEWASYSPDLNPLDYCVWDIMQDMVYEGQRLPFANLQDLKESIKNKWKEVTIETVWKSIAQWKKNDWMQLKSRMEARFSTFSANHCDGYRSYAVRRVELIGYVVCFEHPLRFCVFHCWNKNVCHNFSYCSATIAL